MLLAKIIGAVVGGAVAATAVTFGVVSSQTSPPEQNPANAEIISYGDRS